jgi:hypothetical protein
MTEVRHPWATRAAAGVVATLLVFGAALPAMAAWSGNGSGSAGGAAAVMPTGDKPTASASGSNVTVTWTAASVVNGVNVAGYVIKRYNASTQAEVTVGSGCSGVITATTCTELNVPAGRPCRKRAIRAAASGEHGCHRPPVCRL